MEEAKKRVKQMRYGWKKRMELRGRMGLWKLWRYCGLNEEIFVRSQNPNQFQNPGRTCTAALGLRATPFPSLQTHAAPWTNQLVARRAYEVDLVSNSKHPSKPASISRDRKFGTGRCEKMTSLTL